MMYITRHYATLTIIINQIVAKGTANYHNLTIYEEFSLLKQIVPPIVFVSLVPKMNLTEENDGVSCNWEIWSQTAEIIANFALEYCT